MRLQPDRAAGSPSFDLAEAQIETVIDLLCQGARAARQSVSSGELESSISTRVLKEMRGAKRRLGLTNLEVDNEHQVPDMKTKGDELLGRIDFKLKFLEQFGDEDEYVAVECKRVGAGLHKLNELYVKEGVTRFAAGRYADRHKHGFMLGYVLAEPVQKPVQSISKGVVRRFGNSAALDPEPTPAEALALLSGRIPRPSSGPIKLFHLFVGMQSAL